jgi:hypothetical protein
MKLILAVRQRKNRLLPWGVNRHQAEWNRFLPWGKEKIDYRREAWIAVRWNEIESCREAKKTLIIPMRHESLSGGMKLILAVRQRKNRLSPWGEEKIDYRREAKKNWLSPWGKEKIDIAVRRRKNRLLPWGEEKINYHREAKRKLFITVGEETIDIAAMKKIDIAAMKKLILRRWKNWHRGDEKSISRRRKNWYRGDEKIDIAAMKNLISRQWKIRCCWEFISNTGAPLKRRAKAENCVS